MEQTVQKYVRVVNGLHDKGVLVPETEIYNHVNKKSAAYRSIYFYNDNHLDIFKKTNTIKGIKDVTSNFLIFDFDNEYNLENAKKDTETLLARLKEKKLNSNVFFSGNKGFTVELKLDECLSPDQYKAVVFNLAGDLSTFDKVVNNPSRIIRLPNTIHEESNLYKICIPEDIFLKLSIQEVKEKAKIAKPLPVYIENKLPQELKMFTKQEAPTAQESINLGELDWSKKPKWLTNCRWALQQGFFKEGTRNSVFLCLAATYKNQGFELDHVYRLLKGVAEVQAKRNNSDRFPDEEIYNNICKIVFDKSWQGGQFTCKTPGNFLYNYCQTLGTNKCNHQEAQEVFIETSEFSAKFKTFATEIEMNKVKLGIAPVDNSTMITTSMLVGLLGAPSSGKTTIALDALNYNSQNKINSIFFSMDMGLPLVFLRLLQKHTNLSKEEIFQLYKSSPDEIKRFENIIEDEYEHVKFSFRTSLNVDKIKQSIIDHQNNINAKVKFIVIDYLECIQGPYSDLNANIAIIAQQLKDLANDLELCVLLLLQPQKHAGDPSEPLLSMRNIKGSSVIEQACSMVLTISRPGFSPKHPETDKYIVISSVKDRMGSLFSHPLRWDGRTGNVNDLEDGDFEDLKEIEERMRREKKDQFDSLNNM
jgi:DnaB-like helicase C terminal domain